MEDVAGRRSMRRSNSQQEISCYVRVSHVMAPVTSVRHGTSMSMSSPSLCTSKMWFVTFGGSGIQRIFDPHYILFSSRHRRISVITMVAGGVSVAFVVTWLVPASSIVAQSGAHGVKLPGKRLTIIVCQIHRKPPTRNIASAIDPFTIGRIIALGSPSASSSSTSRPMVN
jgi:hypothetical protein